MRKLIVSGKATTKKSFKDSRLDWLNWRTHEKWDDFQKKKLPDLDGREIRETFDQLNMMKKCPPLIYNRFYTPPKFNITPENRPSQKESPL